MFERLGAKLDLARADALLGEDTAPSARAPRRITKMFMFTDIVTSSDLVRSRRPLHIAQPTQ